MRIEYEDTQILVVYKEAGLPVQSGKTSGKDLVSLLKNYLAQNRPEGSTPAPYLGIVHRLDQPVEGLLVFAKTPKAAAALSRQAQAKGESSPGDKGGAGSERGKRSEQDGSKTGGMEKRPGQGKTAAGGMEKIYIAKVELSGAAYPLALEGRKREILLTDWILRDYAGNRSLIVAEGERDAKRASLSFRTLEIQGSRALLEIRLYTGRHHQIRAQMAHAGMPLAGDYKYGAEGPDEKQLCLCAARLGFDHPSTGRRMQFQVDPGFTL